MTAAKNATATSTTALDKLTSSIAELKKNMAVLQKVCII